MNQSEEQYQSVWITFSNGLKAGFTGKAVVDESDSSLTITDIKFTKPAPLPPNCSFEPMPPRP